MPCYQFHKRTLERGNSSLTSLSCRTSGLTSAWSLTLSFQEPAQCFARVLAMRTWTRLNLRLASSSSSLLSIWLGGYSAFTGATSSYWDLRVITNSWKRSLEEARQQVNRLSKRTRSRKCETHTKTRLLRIETKTVPSLIGEIEVVCKFLNDCKCRMLRFKDPRVQTGHPILLLRFQINME